MTYRKHLFSLRLAYALRESFRESPYTWQRFTGDVAAGLTVGVIAIPLSMALAIASGVAPQYGLYTAIVAGVLIALLGGSRYSVSGPTAAFVVILHPIAETFGIGGLLIATLLSGIILVLMALARLGRFIEYIPESVTLGFTAGIGIVIATLQISDFLGLNLAYSASYVGKIEQILTSLPLTHWPSLLVGGATLACLIVWRRFSHLPPHIPALLLGTLVAQLLAFIGFEVDTIATRFSYLLPNGDVGQGIPPFLPEFMWPWQQMGADGQPIGLSWTLLEALLPAALSIAMLGAIESLLCAVVLDNMTNTRHSANSELLGQGIGNIVVPFFGGITATAAIARSGANLKAGAQTPIASVLHGLVVLLGLLGLAKLLAYLPMASMAALLLLVAWNIADFEKIKQFFKAAPRDDSLVLLTCLSLTVLFDMVLAIAVGIVLAALLFVREIAEMTKVSDITGYSKWGTEHIPDGWRVFRINGALFFAAADRVFSELRVLSQQQKGVVLYMGAVTVLDAGGLAAFARFLDACHKDGIQVIIADVAFQPLRAMVQAGLHVESEKLKIASNLTEATEYLIANG